MTDIIHEADRICGWLNDTALTDPSFRELANDAIDIICLLADKFRVANAATGENDWRDASIELPADPDEMVLVQCSGRAGHDRFDHGYAIATYDGGWIIEDVAGGERLTVEAWMPLPEIWEVERCD